MPGMNVPESIELAREHDVRIALEIYPCDHAPTLAMSAETYEYELEFYETYDNRLRDG